MPCRVTSNRCSRSGYESGERATSAWREDPTLSARVHRADRWMHKSGRYQFQNGQTATRRDTFRLRNGDALRGVFTIWTATKKDIFPVFCLDKGTCSRSLGATGGFYPPVSLSGFCTFFHPMAM